MTGTRVRALALLLPGLAALGLLAAAGLSRPASQPETPGKGQPSKQAATAPAMHREDEQAIRHAFSAYLDAINKGDVEALGALWVPEADYITESGQTTRGREAICALCKPALPHLKGHKASGHIVSIKFISPDVALVDGTLERIAPDDSRESSRFTAAWVRIGDRWLISCARDLPGQGDDGPSMAYSQLKPLEWLVGEWDGKGPRSGAHASCHWAANKSFLLVDYAVKREGEEPKLVTLRIGWDPASGSIRSWVFDSLGGFGEGSWQRDGKRWQVESAGVLPDGGHGNSTDIWERLDDNTYVWHSLDREVDGQPMADVEVKFVRMAAK